MRDIGMRMRGFRKVRRNGLNVRNRQGMARGVSLMMARRLFFPNRIFLLFLPHDRSLPMHKPLYRRLDEPFTYSRLLLFSPAQR